ncbi:LuxR family transcriptional regulator [Magnetovibrio sp. PR-2]|uniref:helix-turn-helix transcriptional regulator n=1 Tax=Magnetovibrio sp. PR-2 TaxID=3120356 RepID=UPI002FCDE453
MIADFVTTSNRATTDAELFELLGDFLKKVGLDAGYAYGALTHFDAYDFKSPLPRPAVTTTYSSDWIHRYAAENYAAVDPTVAMAPKATGPFQWKDLNITDEAAIAFLDEAKHDAGLKQGQCIPLHGPYGDTFAISVASSEDDTLSPDELSQVFLGCAQFHQRFIQLNLKSQKQISLTPRQKECLHWVAANKSNWEIGMIMGISERTVRFHLEKAFEVLEVASREEAIVKAIMFGLISP